MGAFVILTQIASHWPQFFSVEKAVCGLRDDDGIAAAASKEQSKQPFHGSEEQYHFAPVAVWPAK